MNRLAKPSTIAQLKQVALQNPIEKWDIPRSSGDLFDWHLPCFDDELVNWLNTAAKCREIAIKHVERGDLENAFIMFTKLNTILVKRIPHHHNFTSLHPTERHNLHLMLTEVSETIAKIEPILIDRLAEWNYYKQSEDAVDASERRQTVARNPPGVSRENEWDFPQGHDRNRSLSPVNLSLPETSETEPFGLLSPRPRPRPLPDVASEGHEPVELDFPLLEFEDEQFSQIFMLLSPAVVQHSLLLSPTLSQGPPEESRWQARLADLLRDTSGGTELKESAGSESQPDDNNLSITRPPAVVQHSLLPNQTLSRGPPEGSRWQALLADLLRDTSRETELEELDVSESQPDDNFISRTRPRHWGSIQTFEIAPTYTPRDIDLHTEPRERALAVRLAAVFEDRRQYQQLLRCRDTHAQRILDSFQKLLDATWIDGRFRRNLVVAMQRLSKSAGLHPTCYALGDVEPEGEHPVAAGSFADIYRGRYLGHAVCLKVIRLYQRSHVQSFLKRFSAEAILWGQLSHPNLLPIYGLYHYNTRLCLVSPWMENGDLISYLTLNLEANRLYLASDVASGVDYLHTNDIIHGDLKGVNVLVDGRGRACLGDFGLSSVSDPDILHWTSNSSVGSKGGSVRWQAPELFDIDNDDIVHNNKASDVYAVSCVFYEIFTGNVPFFELPRDATVTLNVKVGAQPSRPPVSSPAWTSWGLTDLLWSLMQACWDPGPNHRPTIHEIVTQLVSRPRVDRASHRIRLTPAHLRDPHGVQDLLSVRELEEFLIER